MAIRAPQVAAVLAIVVGVLFGPLGCDSPARVKPWRHAPDPTEEASRAPGSPVLETSGPTEADVRAARAHTVRIHVDAEPGRLTPLVSPSVWARRITLGTIFEPLLRYAPSDSGGPGRFEPRLARSWQVMPTGLEIRIELEPDVTFHDGKPLTTSDVQFTLDAIRDTHKVGVEHLRAMLEDVEAIELITSHQIRLRLRRPSGWVLRALAEIPILPMHVYDGSLLGGGALVGSGPFRYVSNKAGIVHLARFDKYWGGPAPIGDLEFVYQPDAAIALTAAKRGEIDLVPALIPAHWPEQATAPGIAASFKALVLAPPRMRYFSFNVNRAPLDDPRVRHALALLIDRRSIAKRVFDGLARPASWPIWPGGPVDGVEAAVPELDPAGAAKLLDAAGWIDSDRDGNRDRAGKPLRLVMIGGDKPAPKDASGPPVKLPRDYFIDAARRAGVTIEVKTGSESWLEKKIADGNYDIAELTWGGMTDMDVAALLSTRDATTGKWIPLTPRIGRALDALGAAWDPGERARLAPELGGALAEDWPFTGVVADAPQGLISRRLDNIKIWDGWLDLSQLSIIDPLKKK